MVHVAARPANLDLPAGAELRPLSVGMPRLVSPHATIVEAASDGLLGLPCIIPPAGEWQQPARPWRLTLAHPAWIILSVQPFDGHGVDATWLPQAHGLAWRFVGSTRYHGDLLFAKRCDAGVVEIPGHAGRTKRGYPARAHLVLIAEHLPAPAPPEQQAAAMLAELHRIEAIELIADGLSATVQLKPALRLTAFRDGDRPQLLAPPEADPCGIRTWYMEPHQTPSSPLLANRRARCLDRGATHLDLTTDADPGTGLELLWQVRLDQQGHSLRIRHGLRNQGHDVRRLALWSLVAGSAPLRMHSVLRRDAGGAAPAMRIHPMAREGDHAPIIAPLTRPIPGVHDHADGLVLDGSQRADDAAVKLGLRARDGIAALVLGDEALVSCIRAPDGGTHPEGDLNLTSYQSAHIIEIEHVGPLIDLAPGATTWLEQELRQVQLPSSDVASMPAAITG